MARRTFTRQPPGHANTAMPHKAFAGRGMAEPIQGAVVEIELTRMTLRIGDEAVLWVDGMPIGPVRLIGAGQNLRMPKAEARAVLSNHAAILQAPDGPDSGCDDGKSRIIFAISSIGKGRMAKCDAQLLGEIVRAEADNEIRAAARAALKQHAK
jgi:hypothetical protein